MIKRLISGFKDPLKRPRYIMWTGALVMCLAAFVVTMLSATSTAWFCAAICHRVQADTITSWERSSHSLVSCTACHVDPNATPIDNVLGKVVAMKGVPPTILGTFEFPLNPGSRYALNRKEMHDGQCTQCHNLETRRITPSPGIIMDHDVHADYDIQCAACHNRVGHRQDFELALVEPATGDPNTPHEDFMLMTACYRCHTLTDEVPPGGIRAPGECAYCHTPDFELMPAYHLEEGFYELHGDSSGHVEMANADLERRTAALADWEENVRPELTEYDMELVPVAAVNYCATCHIEREFCDGCHGMEIPHPANFMDVHDEEGAADPASCELCHSPSPGADSCNSCHHPQGDPTRAWIPQHVAPVVEGGAQQCFECHSPTFCAECHIRGGN